MLPPYSHASMHPPAPSRPVAAALTRRMVNGIADSQQKGRVALSVNALAESAGLSRLLVDIRHEATHNELPSLSTLQLAARQALDWLVQQYWWVAAAAGAALLLSDDQCLLTAAVLLP